MNPRNILVLAVCALPMAHLHCKKPEQPDAAIGDPDSLGLEKIQIPDGKPSAGREPRITLRQLYPPGRYEVFLMNHSTLRVDGKDEPLRKKKEHWYELTVSGPDAAGQVTMVSQLTRAKYYRSTVGRRLDTDDPDSIGDDDAGKLLMRLLGLEVTLTVDREAKLVRVSGLDRYVDEMESSHPDVAIRLRPLRETMGAEVHRGYLPTLRLLPGEPVGVGAIWCPQSTVRLPGVMETHMRAKCRLSKVARSGHRLLATVEFQSRDTSTVEYSLIPEVTGEDRDQRSTADIAGRFVIDAGSGLLLEHAEWHQIRLSGSVFGQDAPGRVARIKRTTVTVLE